MVNASHKSVPDIFKGIALFTPAGDVIYGIDPTKQGRWHTHLCVGLQELLGLSEPPHFLIPSYTATIDRWFDPNTQQLYTVAEAASRVKPYQTLLNTLFNTPQQEWQIAPWHEESCEPLVIESYRSQFPQLWEEHDLVVNYDPVQSVDEQQAEGEKVVAAIPNYVLRLFVSGDGKATEKTLQMVHQLLETGLSFPYTLKVIDIFKHPEQAEENHVSATPTLVRAYPQPMRRIIGELEDTERVLQILTTV